MEGVKKKMIGLGSCRVWLRQNVKSSFGMRSPSSTIPPQSQSSPLTQRIQFLEAKGLTPAEIDLAVRQATQGSSYTPGYAPTPYPLIPPPPYRWDWRDYFITAVVSGTVTYGAVALFKKYLLPHLQPPTSTAYEADRDALTAQFDAAEALLKEIQAESAAVRAAVEAQKEKIDETTKNVDAMVQENLAAAQSLAGPHPRQSTESPPDARPASPARNRSSDGHASSTGQLAESALSNLRKSLARPASPIPASRNPNAPKPHKMTLEERLKAAAFTIGEASGETTPAVSSRVSPAPVTPSVDKPLDSVEPSRVSSPIELHEPAPILVAAPPPEPPMPPPEPIPLSAPAVDALPVMEPVPLPSEPVLVPSEPVHPSSEPIPSPLEPVQPPEPTPTVSPEPSALLDQVAALEMDLVSPPATTDANLEEVSRISDVDALQERLKLVEQRFSDVSTSFKRLQAEKAAADAVLKELTPIETISDSQALRDFVQNIVLKSEISLEEITRLNGKLATQEERVEELRDTHRLESTSQSAQIETLRKQLAESEAVLVATQGQGNEQSVAQKVEIERLTKEVESSKRVAKEEEEKRVKAISLLKTVRQKLVKAEKERDDIQREVATSRDKDKAERDRDQLEKSKLQSELETVNAEREKAIVGLKTQLDRELASLRDKHEKEIAGMRGQFELEALTIKSSHSKETATLTSRISTLESTLTGLTNDKNAFFDQLQLRQAELESAQFHLDSLQSQNTELQYQLREAEERSALLNDDITEVRREQDSRAREPTTSAEEVARLLSAAEAKYESKLADLRRNLNVVEKERNESEAQWSRKLREKVRENDELKQVLGSATKNRELDEGIVDKLNDQIKLLQEEIRLHQAEAATLRAQAASFEDVESSTKAQETETIVKIHALEQLVEETKSREAQLKISNKTLREELRKVQSSAALLERQRNPGVGYWTSKEPVTPETRTSISSSSDSRGASPAPPTSPKHEEEVNLEYLRNVIFAIP
ncbi:GRIP domain-containing protein [Mycena sanguinolenta]|uniref:Peroxisomal membrane protein PEX14 n=1 Tax=Mycena sanguinolenta TaxID=230812 RepID=A0A8H6XDM2_9AGAR|nr:GRIP domain-containing protein [Mycena sanguinolenta]